MKFRNLLPILVLFIATGLSAQPSGGLVRTLPSDPAVRIGRLTNGLTYYLRHNEHPASQADFYIVQKVGSIQEEDHQRGLAHFLEHMCFNGTTHFPGDSVIRYLETLGVKFGEQLNAYTAIEQTVYNINNVPTTRPSAVDSCLLILHDWSHDLLLSDEEIDNERKVIHEEWRVTSNAYRRIYERSLPRLMSGTRYGYRLPIGTVEVIDNFPYDAIRDYYKTWYRPDLQAIVVVGDIDVNQVEQRIVQMFADIKPVDNPKPREYNPVPDNPEPIVVCEKDKEQALSVVSVMFKHEPYPDSLKNTMDYYVYNFARTMALNMLNRRLQELALQAETPFAQSVVRDGNFMVAKPTAAFDLQLLPKEGHIYPAITAAAAEVFRALQHGFTATEYGRERAEYLSRLETVYNNREKRKNAEFTDEYVNNFLHGEPIPGIEFEYKLLNVMLPKLPVDIVNSVFNSLVTPTDTNLVVLSINPDKPGFVQPEEDKVLQAVRTAREMRLEPYIDKVKNEPLVPQLPVAGTVVKEKPARFGATEWTLSNGVRVLFKKTDYAEDEVHMSAYSHGGTSRYPLTDAVSLANADDVLSISGWGNFTRTELDKALAGKQVDVKPTLAVRCEYLDGQSTPKDLRTLFELTYLKFGAPKRDDAAFASLTAQMRESLRNRHVQPMNAFRDTISATLYGHHPRLVLMDEQKVDQISYDRILEIYAERFADASDFTFVFCGNFDVDSLRHLSCQYLATLPTLKRKDKVAPVDMVYVKGNLKNEFSRVMEQPQVFTLTVWHGLCADTQKNRLMVSILSQALTMRYLEVVREQMGATYSISNIGTLKRNAQDKAEYTFQTFAPLKPEQCDTALTVIREELGRVAAQGVSDAYMSKIKEYLLKSFKESERRNEVWLDRITHFDRYGVDTYTGYEALLNKISSADIAKFARKVLKDGNAATLIMNPQE